MALRVAGRHSAALDESLAAMVLGPEDEALAEQATGLAARLGTEADPLLLVRHEGHYTTVLRGLAARSDAGRARALAAEEAARAAAAARAAPPHWLAQLRARFAEDEKARVAFFARESRRAHRLAGEGLDVDAIAAKMNISRAAVRTGVRSRPVARTGRWPGCGAWPTSWSGKAILMVRAPSTSR